MLVVHSGLERRCWRRARTPSGVAACETAAARIGVATLRDATIEQVADDPLARHVVTENARVEHFAAALRDGDLATRRRADAREPSSLRDDFEVSTPELDLLVELSVDAGAYGARLTGAGFGGCVIALVARTDLEAIAAAVADRYRAETGREPNVFGVSAAAGAGLVAGR